MENTNSKNTIKWKEKLYAMLQDLIDICHDCNIGIFLCGETALRAYEESDISDDVVVCIDASKVYDLIAAVEKMPGYGKEFCLESMLSNGSYPRLELRYCDLNSTDFNVNNYDQFINNCIHITIKFIEHIPLTRISFVLSRIKFKNYKKGIKLPASANTEVSSSVFMRLVKTASGKSQKVWLDGHELENSVFKNYSTVKINGVDYNIPDEEVYFKALYGKDWKEHECKMYEEKSTRFISSDMAWSEYKKELCDFDLAEYRKIQAVERKYAGLFRKEHAEIRHCYDIGIRTFERFYLYQKYFPEKEHILELDKEGKIEELRILLEEYIKYIEKSFKLGLGLCFDKDILEIALKILEQDKGHEYAEKARALVPTEHLKAIRIKDYRGNYI